MTRGRGDRHVRCFTLEETTITHSTVCPSVHGTGRREGRREHEGKSLHFKSASVFLSKPVSECFPVQVCNFVLILTQQPLSSEGGASTSEGRLLQPDTQVQMSG